MRTEQSKPLIVGWRETVDLPLWGIRGLLAKCDTGARGCAIDVEDIVALGDGRVRFAVVHSRKKLDARTYVEADLSGTTRVRSSNGMVQTRFRVKTTIAIGGIEKEVELSLVPRPKMLCRVLLGRKALEGDFLVDPGKRHLMAANKV